MKGAIVLLGMVLAANLTGCKDDDPDYENVTPPVVEIVPNILTGVVTSISGDGIANATVTLSGTASATANTNADGIYTFPNIKAGTYKMKVEAKDKVAKEGDITVTETGKSQTLIWNAVLAGNVKTEVTVSATENSTGNVATEAMKGNEKAAVKVEAAIPADAVEVTKGEIVKIGVAPIYNESNVTRATESSTMLVGTNLTCSKSGATLRHAIELTLNLDEELAAVVEAKMYKNGTWTAAKSRVEKGKVIIEASEFASYGLFIGVSFTTKNSSTAISFSKNEWDNLYGAQEMKVDNATYDYKVGTKIATQATTVLTALLVEKTAQKYGAKLSTVAGNYPLNVTLPVGTKLSLSGTQAKTDITVSAKGKSISGVQYGEVAVKVTTANRQHTGGSN